MDSKGYFVKIVNAGDQPDQLNGCNIQQSVNDRLVAAFKFPNGVSIDPGQTITVSNGVMCDHMMLCDAAVGVGTEERHDAQPSTRLCLA